MLIDVARSALNDTVRKAALEALAQRKRTAPAPVDQSTLIAGSPMTFYCRTCGHVCDTKQEDYLFPPYKHCSECNWMIAAGWVPE